MKLVGPRPFPS